MKRPFTVLVVTVMLLMAAVFTHGNVLFAEDDAQDIEIAEDLSDQCDYSGSKDPVICADLKDDDYKTIMTLDKKEYIVISWDEDVKVSFVLVEFLRTPGAYTITQYDEGGNKISSRKGLDKMVNDIEYVDKDTRSVKINCSGSKSLEICGLKAYGPGELNDRHKWEPTPEKLDFLVVSMHPDDDVIFLGAIMPVFTGEYGYTGSSLVMATNNRTRREEYLNGEWELGQRTAPLCGSFPDIRYEENAPEDTRFKEETVVPYLVNVIRRYRPEVIFTQDLNGEYGHWQHARLAQWVLKAVPLAAYPDYDEKTLDKYGTWEVKKLYVHLYEEGQIKLDVGSQLSSFGGRTAFEVATAAFEWHKTQHNGHHWVKNEGVYSLSDFGLAYTTVGPDTEGLNDPFEHTGIMCRNLIRWHLDRCLLMALNHVWH